MEFKCSYRIEKRQLNWNGEIKKLHGNKEHCEFNSWGKYYHIIVGKEGGCHHGSNCYPGGKKVAKEKRNRTGWKVGLVGIKSDKPQTKVPVCFRTK